MTIIVKGRNEVFLQDHVADVIALYAEVESVISQMQMAQLLQVLAVLSNTVDDESVRLKLLQMAVIPSIEHIRSIQWSFEGVMMFIKFNGFDGPPAQSKDQLRRALTCVQGAVQQVNRSSPLANLLIPILPTFFKLSRCLMDLHSEDAKLALHPFLRDNLTKIAPFEKQQIYCTVGENIEPVTGGFSTVESDFVSVERQYVHDLNEQMKSVLCECPKARYQLVREFFERIVEAMNNRLQNIWAEVTHIDYDSEPTEEELFFEHMTCVLSREYISFLRCCFISSDGEEYKATTMTPLGQWLFSNKIGLPSVIMTAFSALTFRDSVLVLKAVTLCKVLAEKLSDCYDDQVGVYMLVCSIRSLQLHGADEVTGTPLIGLVFHIYFALRRFSDSLLQVLMQVPNLTADIVESFDNRVRAMISGDEVILEKQKKEMARKLFKGLITLTIGEQHKKPVYLRPLPPIEKRRGKVNEPDDFENIALLFAYE
ncbi:unnamed protein product [Haemonchus placei]|uniref:Exportin-5 domain-containing protein n=1 Tax=Haemonchus placei TaxID=6290 RepID=A0A0N4WNF5_HAEPC|nr:unnamed protein product [Haemonchus placei]